MTAAFSSALLTTCLPAYRLGPDAAISKRSGEDLGRQHAGSEHEDRPLRVLIHDVLDEDLHSGFVPTESLVQASIDDSRRANLRLFSGA